MVVSDNNIATIRTAEKKYAETLALLAKQNIQPVPVSETTTIAAITPVRKHLLRQLLLQKWQLLLQKI